MFEFLSRMHPYYLLCGDCGDFFQTSLAVSQGLWQTFDLVLSMNSPQTEWLHIGANLTWIFGAITIYHVGYSDPVIGSSRYATLTAIIADIVYLILLIFHLLINAGIQDKDPPIWVFILVTFGISVFFMTGTPGCFAKDLGEGQGSWWRISAEVVDDETSGQTTSA